MGGGIFGSGSAIDIKNTEILYNEALFEPSSLTSFMSYGGGLFLVGCSSIIENSIISYNTSITNGGGVALNSTNIEIYKTKISNNKFLTFAINYFYFINLRNL